MIADPSAPQFRTRTSHWGNEPVKATPPSRQAVLDWVRSAAPDLRLGKMLTCEHLDGPENSITRHEHRRCLAVFTFGGARFELVSCASVAEDPDDHVVRLCEEALRKAMNLEPGPWHPRPMGLEQQVIEADLLGDTTEVARLTHLLVSGQPRDASRFRPIPIRKKTP